MLRLLKNEWNKVRFPVLSAIMLVTLAALILCSTLYKDYMLNYDLDVWEIGTEYFGLLYPLFVTIPLCWNLYYERRNAFLVYVCARTRERKYLRAKWMIYALSAFCILFLPYALSALFVLYGNSIRYMPSTTEIRHVFFEVYTEEPLRYAILLSAWKGIIGILVMNLGFVLALYGKNIFVILTGPFIYCILENFIWSIAGLARYRLITSFEPTCVSSKVVTPAGLLVGPALLLAVTGMVWLYEAKARRRKVVEV